MYGAAHLVDLGGDGLELDRFPRHFDGDGFGLFVPLLDLEPDAAAVETVGQGRRKLQYSRLVRLENIENYAPELCHPFISPFKPLSLS